MNNVKSIIQSHDNFVLSKYNELTAQINKNNNKHNTINDNNNYSDNKHVVYISLDRKDNNYKNNKVNINNNDNVNLINK